MTFSDQHIRDRTQMMDGRQMIRALFLDVDGTIISTRTKKIPESASEAIRKAREAGVKLFPCTSRAKQFLSNLSAIDSDGIVALTGAHCLDPQGRDIGCRPMAAEDTAAALTDVLRRDVPVVAMSPECIFMNHPSSPQITDFLATGGLTPDDIPGIFQISSPRKIPWGWQERWTSSRSRVSSLPARRTGDSFP